MLITYLNLSSSLYVFWGPNKVRQYARKVLPAMYKKTVTIAIAIEIEIDIEIQK